MNISFKAHFIQTTCIKKLEHPLSSNYIDCDAVILELQPEHAADYTALSNIATTFENERIAKINRGEKNEYNYTLSIYENFRRTCADSEKNIKRHFYILTAQLNNFDMIDAQKVLGAAEIKPNSFNDTNELKYLQTNPSTNFSSENRLYKGIGNALWEYIRERFNNKRISVIPDDYAVGFYEKLGFESLRDAAFMVYRHIKYR